MKLADAAIATAIISACGERWSCAAVLRTIGAISNTNAAVGTMLVAAKVTAISAAITATGPNSPPSP